MPSSPIQGFSMADGSTQGSFDCTTSIPGNYGESKSNIKDVSNNRFQQGHALLRKQMQRPIILQAQKAFGRRRFTFSGNQEQKLLYKKRRRFTSVALPTKFLLGGNIKDPLNLRSLQDEKVNQQLNEFSPASSPMPMSNRRTQVQVLVPPNIYDPLNLNTGEDIEFNLLSSKPRKRRRHRKSRKEDDSLDISPTTELPKFRLDPSLDASGLYLFPLDDCIDKQFKNKATKPEPSVNKDDVSTPSPVKKLPEKVSTPICQESPKVSKLAFNKKASKDECTKNAVQKQAVKHRKSKVRQDTVKFRANTEKFCYGNHVGNPSNWIFGVDSGIDHRLRFLSENFFHGKDVLDVGCNVGQLSLHIALHYHPNKVVGIDIDKKLLNKAERTLRHYLSKEVQNDEEFPSSMASLYGPLAKLVKPTIKNPHQFPNNVMFFEANYVPASEDFLETQKPEYDTILCLRVTKWIHLNFGDEGLKMSFKRMFAQLREGGVLILEPQPWFTYSASKKITPAIHKTYQSLKMRPDMFCSFLQSSEVGFGSCQLLGKTFNYKKGYRQDIFILKKASPVEQEQCPLDLHVSPIPYEFDGWSNEYPSFDKIPIGDSFSDYERHTNFDGTIREDFSSFEPHQPEDYANFEQHANEDLLKLEHSNECFSDCEEHMNEVF